jgi:glyoxylase-like metal-dependent hydrolase (beta-lactamase superfamily II)
MEPIFGDRISEHLYRVAWWDMAGQDIVNCDVYAIDCGEVVALIDSGRGGHSYSALKTNLIHFDLWDRVSVCLLTHLHKDHAGGGLQLMVDGVKVWGGIEAGAYIQDKRAQIYFEDNVPQLDRVLRDGECFSLGNMQFEILATPGHTSTCVTYFVTVDSVRCAFTGDLVMPNGTIGYSGSSDFNTNQLIGSLKKTLDHEFDAVLTGHMLRSTQPEGFWMQKGKDRVRHTLQAGLEGKWPIQKSRM